MRLIFAWLLISLAATGVFTYRHHHHRGGEAAFSRSTEGARPSASAAKSRDFSSRDSGRSFEAPGGSSNTESLALMVSIISSIVSALAAVAQAWFTHRAIKDGRSSL
jgi:hypothetical protein